MIKFLKKRWYIVIILFAVIGLIFYQIDVVKSKAKKESIYKVKRQTLKETLSLSGKIDANEKAILRFQNSGMLSAVGVKEGVSVKKYQWVASLDQRELQSNLKKYLNTYLKNRWDFDTTKEDKDIKNIGGLNNDQRNAALRVLDKAQFDLNNSVVDVELKDLALKYANLYSPIDGIVVRVDSPYPGVNVTPSQAEFEIINPKSVYFSASVDQSDVVKLQKNQTGKISFDAFADDKIGATLTSVGFTPKSGETGTVYEAKLQMSDDNSNYKYRMGMTGDAEFVLRQKADVISVPITSIKSQNGKKYVIKLENGKKIRQEIEIGDTFDTIVEVTSGIKDGDIIL